MRGVYFNGTGAEFRDDLQKPVPSATESLIRILYAGVCNTDRDMSLSELLRNHQTCHGLERLWSES